MRKTVTAFNVFKGKKERWARGLYFRLQSAIVKCKHRTLRAKEVATHTPSMGGRHENLWQRQVAKCYSSGFPVRNEYSNGQNILNNGFPDNGQQSAPNYDPREKKNKVNLMTTLP